MNKILLIISICISLSFKLSDNSKVYICKSPTSYAYHKDICQGLEQCTHEVLCVTLEDALNKYGKKNQCKYCY